MSSRASRPRSKSARSKRQRLAAGAVLATTSLLGTYLAAIRPTPTYAAPDTGTSTSNRTSVDESVLRPLSVSTSSLKTCADAAPQDIVSDDTELRAAILRSDDDSVICIDGAIDLLGTLPTIDDTSLTLVGENPLQDRLVAYLDYGTSVFTRILPVDFSGASDDTLIINNLGLSLGYDSSGGGAIYFDANDTDDRLIVNYGVFRQNTASGNGGAIRMTNGSATLTHSLFDSNESYFGYGGALAADAGSIVLALTGFYLNDGYDGGGAISISGGATLGAATVSLQDNLSTYGAGAVHVNGGTAAFLNSYIGGNESTSGAGAIYATNGSIRLNFSTLYDNSSSDPTQPAGIGLDASSTLRAVGSVVGSVIDDTVLSIAGGATVDDTFSITTGSGTAFTGLGSQQVAGGSLELAINNGPLIGENGRAPANTSILVTDAPNSQLGTLADTDQLGVRRGPGYWTIGARQVNPPTPAGCDVLATDDTVLRASILNSQDEDVICIDGTITLTAPLPMIDDTTLTLVGDDSSVDIIDGNNGQMLTVDFSEPSQDDTLTISNLTFYDGTNSGYGGAIQVTGDATSAAYLSVQDSTFYLNGANGLGGAVSTLYANVGIADSLFKGNFVNAPTGDSAGGAVSVLAGDVSIAGSTFLANLAPAPNPGDLSLGGAVSVSYGDAVINDSYISANSALLGAGIGATEGDITIENSVLRANVAISSTTFTYGGGVYALDGDITITDSYLISNIADYGGAVFLDDSSVPTNTLTLLRSEFVGNEAVGGGAVSQNGGSMSVSQVAMIVNEAARGGGVYLIDTTATITNSYLGSNIAYQDGGASLYTRNSDTSLLFSSVYDDSSAVAGKPRSIFTDNSTLSVIGSAVGSPTDDTVIELTNGSTMDDTYSISTGLGAGFTGTGSQQVAGGGLGLAAFNRVGPRTAGRSPEEGSILLSAAPTSDLGTGVTVDQLGDARGPRWTIGARQNPAASPTPPPAPTPPSAPSGVSATAGDGEATITWTAPASAGSFPITNYQAVVAPGGQSCLVVSPATECTITGLTNGTEYTATVRALSGAGWGAYSSPSEPFTPDGPEPPVTKTIVITGTRGEVRGRPGIIVTGATTGFDAGEIVRPWIKLPGQTSYSEGVAQIRVESNGEFTWQRRTGKKIYVFVRSEDGQIRSNRIVIRPR